MGGPKLEETMAGYPHLRPDSRRSFGRLEDDAAYVKVTTRFGDTVGAGALRHYALPE